MKLTYSVRELKFSDAPNMTPVFATIRIAVDTQPALLTTEFIELRFRVTGLPHGDAAVQLASARALEAARALLHESAAVHLLQQQQAE